MNSAELVEFIVNKTKIETKRVRSILDNLQEIIAQELNEGEEVKISGFGSFFIVNYPPRTIIDRHDPTKKRITSNKKVAKFKPSAHLVASIRGEILEPERHTVSSENTLVNLNNLSELVVPQRILRLVPEHFARYHHLAVVGIEEGKAIVVTSRPLEHSSLKTLEEKINREIIIQSCNQTILNYILGQYEEVDDNKIALRQKRKFVLKELPKKFKPIEIKDDSPSIRIIKALLKYAEHKKATDVYFEPKDDKVKVFFADEGEITEIGFIPKNIFPAVLSYVKIINTFPINNTKLKWWLI